AAPYRSARSRRASIDIRGLCGTRGLFRRGRLRRLRTAVILYRHRRQRRAVVDVLESGDADSPPARPSSSATATAGSPRPAPSTNGTRDPAPEKTAEMFTKWGRGAASPETARSAPTPSDRGNGQADL